MDIKDINELVSTFSELPGIGEKSAERIVYALLNKSSDNRLKMIDNIKNLDKIKKCQDCNNLTLDEICSICNDKSREAKTICVVDDIKNLILFERNQLFPGKYFILSGLINPLQGIDITDLNLDGLDRMISKNNSVELILALKPTIEGETTSLYISKKYSNKLKVTKMAQGIPLGAEIEYLDPITLTQAFQDRKEI